MDDWDLELSLRDQQFIDHLSKVDDWDLDSPLRISSCLLTPSASGHLPTDCGQHLANPLPWHWHEHPAWTSTCMGKDNTAAFTRNTCGLLFQLGKHLVRQLLAAEDLAVTCESSFKQNMTSHRSITSKVLDSCQIFLQRDEEQTPLICREKSH